MKIVWHICICLSVLSVTFGYHHEELPQIQIDAIDKMCTTYEGCHCSTDIHEQMIQILVFCSNNRTEPDVIINPNFDYASPLTVKCLTNEIEIDISAHFKIINGYEDEPSSVVINDCRLKDDQTNRIGKMESVTLNNVPLNEKLHILNNLTQLESLYLFNNNLTSLNGLNLTKLKILSSTNNEIENITTTTFANLIKLEELNFVDFGNKSITNLFSNVFKNMKLKSVHVESDHLTSVESGTFDWPELQYVTLINPKKCIESLPKNVFGSNVRFAQINCGLRTIERTTFAKNASKLYHLDLSGNNLKKLPPNLFANLTKLNFLNFSHNELSDISNIDFNFTTGSMITLDLSYNKLCKWKR